jgi:hypothetical protein
MPAFWQSLRRLFSPRCECFNLLKRKGMAEREGFSSAIFRILRQGKEIAIRPSNGYTWILSTVQTFSTATTLNIPTFPSNGMDSMDPYISSRPAYFSGVQLEMLIASKLDLGVLLDLDQTLVLTHA